MKPVARVGKKETSLRAKVARRQQEEAQVPEYSSSSRAIGAFVPMAAAPPDRLVVDREPEVDSLGPVDEQRELERRQARAEKQYKAARGTQDTLRWAAPPKKPTSAPVREFVAGYNPQLANDHASGSTGRADRASRTNAPDRAAMAAMLAEQEMAAPSVAPVRGRLTRKSDSKFDVTEDPFRRAGPRTELVEERRRVAELARLEEAGGYSGVVDPARASKPGGLYQAPVSDEDKIHTAVAQLRRAKLVRQAVTRQFRALVLEDPSCMQRSSEDHGAACTACSIHPGP